MDLKGWRAEWGYLLATSIISFVLYQLNMVVLFCIPLQVLLIRKGEKEFIYACLSVMATIIITAFIRVNPVEDALLKRAALLTGIAIPAFILGGFAAANLPWKIRLRTLYKALAVSLAAGIVSIPVLYVLGRNDGFSQFLKGQIESVVQLLQMGLEEGDAAVFNVDVDTLAASITGILLRNFLFAYFLIIAGSVWVGRGIAGRIFGATLTGLHEFRLPDRMIWLLLISWSLVLVDYLTGIGAVVYAGWNFGSIMLFMYGVQGSGIIQTLLDRYHVSRYLRILIVTGMFVLVFWPGINLVILIGVPLLGVSELWIHYRKEQKE